MKGAWGDIWQIINAKNKRERRGKNCTIKGNEIGVDSEQDRMPTDKRKSKIESTLLPLGSRQDWRICLYKKEYLCNFSSLPLLCRVGEFGDRLFWKELEISVWKMLGNRLRAWLSDFGGRENTEVFLLAKFRKVTEAQWIISQWLGRQFSHAKCCFMPPFQFYTPG